MEGLKSAVKFRLKLLLPSLIFQMISPMRYCCLIACLMLSLAGFSQSKSTFNRIKEARAALKWAFEDTDAIGVNLWADSLARIENDRYVALVWDERHLIYYWLGAYGNVLEEASRYDAQKYADDAAKVQPPIDSLYETLDRELLEQRFTVYEDIGKSFLNEEERAFSILYLDYLLRLTSNEQEWAERLEGFLHRYPNSRFSTLIRSIKPVIAKPGQAAWAFNLGYFRGQWSNQLERYFRPLNGIEIGLCYWKKRITYQAIFVASGAKLDRDYVEQGYLWPRKDPYRYIKFDVELGYDLVNNSEVRFYPSVGIGLGGLGPTSPDDDEDPNPEYYSIFSHTRFHFCAAFNAELKMFPMGPQQDLPKGSYSGIRLRAGYQHLRFDQSTPDLAGNLFFVSLGFNIFARTRSWEQTH
jgi:hypothetical protein